MKTEIISFNARDRARKYRGVPRNYDTMALAATINGPLVQERVKRRDLTGFLGHWVRERYGLEPKEAVIVDGKVVPLEPAVVTTMLEADPDGTIRHQAEFLDTATGRTAARMHSSRSGGFSAVIPLDNRSGDILIPSGFLGFDYVREPNFSDNRGYALDSAAESLELAVALDSVVAEHSAALATLDSACNALQGELEAAGQAMARMKRDNEWLMHLLARRPDAPALLAAMDSAGSFTRPETRLIRSAAMDSAGAFLTMDLAALESMPEPKADPKQEALAGDAARIVRNASRWMRGHG